ncbi:MAG: PEP-CTERM sorting domain-containing protein [Verrucomicrobiota bacterium]
MNDTSFLSAWLRGASLAVMMAVMQRAAFAEIIYMTPPEPLGYANFIDRTTGLDLNRDGVDDYLLVLTPTAVSLQPQGNNSVAADGNLSVVPIARGDLVASSSPSYQWVNSSMASGGNIFIGAGAIFDGETFYSGNLSDTNAFIGLRFEIGGAMHYGWMEVYNYPGVPAGQIFGWAYETDPNTPFIAGAVPEPSTWALLAAGAVLMFWRRKRSA